MLTFLKILKVFPRTVLCFYENSLLQGYKWVDVYKVIGIYIDTPAFDRVTKDAAAKPVDKFAIVGGTFGLFTGFSIISGVEIIYHLARFLWTQAFKKGK